MANIDTLELVNQENGLIKSTPTEETRIKLIKMRAESIRAENGKIRNMTFNSLEYVVQYLRCKQGFSIKQVESLSSEDLNRLPEIIIAERAKKVLLLGWIPLFGWIFAGQYLLFKSNIIFLKSLDDSIFNAEDIPKAIDRACFEREYW